MPLSKRVLSSGLGLAALILLAPGAHVASGAQVSETPVGLWIDHTGRGAVEITECGAALCGRVVWLKDVRNRQACGTQVIGQVKPAGGGVWGGGWIYDPEQDAKYSVELKPLDDHRLMVVGYLGTKLFSETMIWKRAPGDLKRCGTASSAETGQSRAPAVVKPVQSANPAPAVEPSRVAKATESTKSATNPPETTVQPAGSPLGPTVAPPTGVDGKVGQSAVTGDPGPSGDGANAPAPPAAAEQAPVRTARAQPCTMALPYLSITVPCKFLEELAKDDD